MMKFRDLLCWLFGLSCQTKSTNQEHEIALNGAFRYSHDENIQGGKHSRRKTRRNKKYRKHMN
jgi:hypothetical protein